MKKNLVFLFSLMTLTLLLGACSSSEGAKLEEIYTKSAEASKNLENFAMTIESEQTIDMEGESAEESPLPMDMPIKTTIDSEMQMDPVAFHQTVETMGQSMEQYYTEEGMFMSMPGQDGWFKAPQELVDQMNTMTSQQQTPAQQLESLKDYVDEFGLETDGDHYVLSFTSEGEDVQKLIEESMKENMPEGMLPEGALEGMTVNKVSYEFTIDKETYYPQSMMVDMDFTMEQNGQTVTIQQHLNGEYSRFNEVGEISIPAKIKENAKEMPGIDGL